MIVNDFAQLWTRSHWNPWNGLLINKTSRKLRNKPHKEVSVNPIKSIHVQVQQNPLHPDVIWILLALYAI